MTDILFVMGLVVSCPQSAKRSNPPPGARQTSLHAESAKPANRIHHDLQALLNVRQSATSRTGEVYSFSNDVQGIWLYFSIEKKKPELFAPKSTSKPATLGLVPAFHAHLITKLTFNI
jgi:hypothetical protein